MDDCTPDSELDEIMGITIDHEKRVRNPIKANHYRSPRKGISNGKTIARRKNCDGPQKNDQSGRIINIYVQ